MVRLVLISIVAIFGLSLSVASPQTGRRQPKSRSSRPKTKPKKVSAETIHTKEEPSPLDKLFKAAVGLKSAWEKRSRFGSVHSDDYILLSAMADQLTTIGQQAKAFVEDDGVKDTISRMSKAYRDSVDLHGLVLRRNDPLANEADQRAQYVKELRELKDRRYREWDDPVIRDQLTARIEMIEAVMRMSYRDDSQTQRLKEESIKLISLPSKY